MISRLGKGTRPIRIVVVIDPQRLGTTLELHEADGVHFVIGRGPDCHHHIAAIGREMIGCGHVGDERCRIVTPMDGAATVDRNENPGGKRELCLRLAVTDKCLEVTAFTRIAPDIVRDHVIGFADIGEVVVRARADESSMDHAIHPDGRALSPSDQDRTQSFTKSAELRRVEVGHSATNSRFAGTR